MKTRSLLSIIFIIGAFTLAFSLPLPGFAADEFTLELEDELHPHEPGAQETPEIQFPEIEPEVTLGGGYRIFSSKDSRKIPGNEYISTESTPIYLMDASVFRFPDRFTMEFIFESKPKAHYADIGYGYRDLLLARGLNRAVNHNLENIRILDVGGDTIQLDNASEKYAIRTMISTANLRVKAPGYPAHVLVEYDQVQKNGERQQKWLAGNSYHSGSWKETLGRDVEFLTNQYGVGLNSHLGPVEAEYSFAVKNFEDSGDDILYAARGSNGIYPAGTWPHNMNPELHQYKHTFKLHTMYTGKITASGTVSKTGMENDFSDAERDIFNAGGAVTFTPITALTFSAKYRHRKVKNDTPASVIIRDASGTIESSEVNPRESISYLTDTINFDARYRAARWLTLRGGVDFNKETRRHTEDWGDLEDASRKWAWNVGADTRFWRSLQVKGGYTNTKAKNPAYNVQPDQAHEFKGAVTWMPMDFLNVFGSYKYTREEREDIHFVGEYLDGESHADERRAHKHDGSAMVTLLLTRWFSVHANYGYFRNYTQQDLVHATSNPPAALGSSGDFRSDPGIWYENESQVYGGGINVDPGRNFHLNAGITFVNTKGEFKYHWREVTPDPMDIGALSEVKTEDMIIHAGTRIGLPDNFGLGIDYQYSRFQERADNGFSDLDDGQAHVVMLTLTKTLGKGT